MKNVTAKVIILLLMTSCGLWAQSESKYRFGIHGSPAFSYIQSDDPQVDTKLQMKFGFGLMMEYNFAANYSLSTGVDYFWRGGELSNDTIGTRSYKSGFVQIPFLLKMRTREFGYFRHFAEFGGNLGISTDETVEPFSDEQDSYISWGGVMFTIGLGTEYSLGGGTSLLAGIYFNHSLFNNLNEDKPFLAEDKNYRFDYVNLKVGVLF